MNKLIYKIVCLVVIVFLLSKFIRSCFSYLSISPYTESISLLSKTNEDINVYFLGTSRVQRGVNPEIFDKVANSKLKINSFNYSLAGASAGEVYGLLSNLLESPNPSLKYILVEIQSIQSAIRDNNFFGVNKRTNRNKYWVDLEQYTNMTNIVKGMNPEIYSISQKRNAIFNYTTSFLENQFNVGIYESFVTSNIEENKRFRNSVNAGYNKGYFPLDLEKSKRVLNRNKYFLSNNPNLSIENHARTSSQKHRVKDVNVSHLNILNKYIEKGRAKNIEVIYLFPHIPAPASFNEIKAVYDQLPIKNKLNVSPRDLNPELYKVEYYFDNTHLNNKGAGVYSQILSKEFTSKILK